MNVLLAAMSKMNAIITASRPKSRHFNTTKNIGCTYITKVGSTRHAFVRVVIAVIPVHTAYVQVDQSQKNGKISSKTKSMRLKDILQMNRTVPSTIDLKLKTASLDDTIIFKVCRLQFEKTATANNWSNEEISAPLFFALKGPAAGTLQTTQ